MSFSVPRTAGRGPFHTAKLYFEPLRVTKPTRSRVTEFAIIKAMAAGYLRDDEGEALRTEIRNALPYGGDWLMTPHQLLGGDTPQERILADDLESVRNLFHSILYIGVA